MDLDDLKSDEASAIVEELNSLIKKLRAMNLKISSWAGRLDSREHIDPGERINRGYGYKSIEGAADDNSFPWFLYWEIVWVVLNGGFKPGDTVLDLGGSSSLFSYYLASKGLDITAIELKRELVDNANLAAKRTGWKLKNYVMDMRELSFDLKFDHVTSMSVYHILPVHDRRLTSRTIGDLLVEGGRFSVTFDYRNPAEFRQINSPEDLYEQFVRPSGLRIRGNRDFFDNGKNYLLHPFYYEKRLWKLKITCLIRQQFSMRDILRTKHTNDYTFGALFLEKADGG